MSMSVVVAARALARFHMLHPAGVEVVIAAAAAGGTPAFRLHGIMVRVVVVAVAPF